MDAQNRVLIPPKCYWTNGNNCHLQPTLEPKPINRKCTIIYTPNCHMKNFNILISEALCNQEPTGQMEKTAICNQHLITELSLISKT